MDRRHNRRARARHLHCGGLRRGNRGDEACRPLCPSSHSQGRHLPTRVIPKGGIAYFCGFSQEVGETPKHTTGLGRIQPLLRSFRIKRTLRVGVKQPRTGFGSSLKEISNFSSATTPSTWIARLSSNLFGKQHYFPPQWAKTRMSLCTIKLNWKK